MKYFALLFFSSFLIYFSSCEKDATTTEDLLDHTIRLTDQNSDECKSLFTYDSQNRVLSANGWSCGEVGKTSYTYNDNSFIPVKIENPIPANEYFFEKHTTLSFTPPVLTTVKSEIRANYTKTDTIKYILDLDFKVLFRLNSTNDTTAVYQYQNNNLQKIATSDKYSTDTTYFEYNANNQLTIVSEESYPSTHGYINTFIYNKGKLAGYNFHTSYSYSSGIISTIDPVSGPPLSVTPYSYFEPIQMDPINVFIYPYLELHYINHS